MSGLKDAFWGGLLLIILSLLFAAIVFPLLYLRTTFLYKPVIFLAYPFLVVVAWNGYPLAYNKITGRRFIRELEPSTWEDYRLFNGKIYKHRGYDKENINDESLSPEERGFELYQQRHEYLTFPFYIGDDPEIPHRLKGELSPEAKRSKRIQTYFRLIFIFITIALSEPWLNALGTSWIKIFESSK